MTPTAYTIEHGQLHLFGGKCHPPSFAELEFWEELKRVESERDEAFAYIQAIWKQNLLPTPMSPKLFKLLTETR